jgi:hypothetical protein
MRGREALRRRLERHLPSFGMKPASSRLKKYSEESGLSGQKAEVMP